MIITYEILRDAGACVQGMTAAAQFSSMEFSELIRSNDRRIRDEWKVWVACSIHGALTRKHKLEFLARTVERSLSLLESPDPRSLAVVYALRIDAVTKEILKDAWAVRGESSAAWAADAANVPETKEQEEEMQEAMREATAWAADAWGADCDSERAAQVADLIDITQGVES